MIHDENEKNTEWNITSDPEIGYYAYKIENGLMYLAKGSDQFEPIKISGQDKLSLRSKIIQVLKDK